MHSDRCGRNIGRNVLQMEVEKKLKYKILCKEIQRMWNMRCLIVPVIIGATEVVKTTNVEHEIFDCTGNNWSHRNSNRRLKESFESHTRKTFNRFATKYSCTGTSHIIRKVLQSETEVWAVGIAVGSRGEVPGRKVLWQDSNNDIIMTTIIIQKKLKNKQVQRPRDRGQQDVETEDKNCDSCNWNIRNK